ncbi:hypothetical protein [Scytonema sp. NUACC26]|uniref:hypothetical protein n=1 Tax=Scytonema sp. NUACC26 TaxID=3140176 RepID=UPI0034DC8239
MMKLLKKLNSLITGFNRNFKTEILQTSSSKALTINFSGRLTGSGISVFGARFSGKLQLPITLDELYQQSQFHSILETTSITSDRGIILPVDIRLSVFKLNSNYSYSLFISSGLTGISAYYDINQKKDVIKDFKIPSWVVQEHHFLCSGFDSVSGNLQESEIDFHNVLIQVQKKSTVLVSKNFKIQDNSADSRIVART